MTDSDVAHTGNEEGSACGLARNFIVHSDDASYSRYAFTLWRSCRPWTLSIAVMQSMLCVLLLSVKFGVTIPVSRTISMTVAFMSLQIFCNIHNAYADFFRGLDTKENAKDRVLVDNILSRRTVLLAMMMFSGVFFVYCLSITADDRPIEEKKSLLAIGAAGTLFAYAYSGEPMPLKTYGVGEWTLFLCIGILMPWFQSIYLSGTLYPAVLWMLLPSSFYQTGINHANHYRDIEVDQAAGAWTCANLLGHYWARLYYICLVVVIPHSSALVLAWYYDCAGILCVQFALPLSITLAQMANGSRAEVFVLVKRTAKVHFIIALCMSIGIYSMPSTTLSPIGIGLSAVVAFVPAIQGLRGEVKHLKYW